MSKLSPTLKITIILAAIYAIGWLGIKFWAYHSIKKLNCTQWGCGIGEGIALSAWQYIFPAVAIIIIIATIIMEAIDAKRKNKNNDRHP